MIRLSVDHLRFLEQQLQQIEGEILGKISESGLEHPFHLLQSIPGVQQDSAAVLLAEIGPDVRPFPSAARLSSWTGVCPGNHRSTGKERDSHINHGNRWLRTALVECAWAASVKKDCFLRERFWRLAIGNRKRALIAIAHALLVLIYNALATGEPYQEHGAVELDEAKRRRLIRHHIRRLGRLGVCFSSRMQEYVAVDLRRKHPTCQNRNRDPLEQYFRKNGNRVKNVQSITERLISDIGVSQASLNASYRRHLKRKQQTCLRGWDLALR